MLVDEDPHFAGIFVAERLADLGRAVEIVTARFHAGNGLHINFVPEVYGAPREEGRLVPGEYPSVPAIEPDRVRLLDRLTGLKRASRDIDGVVLAMGTEAHDELGAALLGEVPQLLSAGDCIAPRRIDEAILDGERAGHMA